MRSFLILALALGCSSPDPGLGTGRPAGTPVDRPESSSLRVAEVYVADADTGEHFVEVVVDDAETVSLSGAELCGPNDCFAASCTASEVQLGDRVTCAIGDLDLPASAGELAVLVDGTVLAYLAWGADPAVFASPWAAAAVLAEATEPGAFVPLPFPMPDGVAALNQADGSQGCGAPSPGASGTIDELSCAAVDAPLVLTEILAPATEEDASWVEIENTSASPVRLAGVRLCQLPTCVALGYRDTIGAGGRLLVHLGREGSDNTTELFFATAEPVRPGGEIVLVAPGAGDLANEAPLLSFLRYGTSLTGEVSAAAVRAGLWHEILDTARTARVAGESLSRDFSGELRGRAWNPTEPTPLAENPDIGVDTDLWTSCSFPRPWREAQPSDLVIARLSRTEPEVVLLRNRGDAPVDLLGYELAFAGATRRIDDAGSGRATGANDEAVARLPDGIDTDVDSQDFARASGSPGRSNDGSACTGGLVINELVTDPELDWSDSDPGAGAPAPFDGTPGVGTVDSQDQWIELVNCGSEAVDLSAAVLRFIDSTPNTLELSAPAGQILVGELTLAPGGYFVVGTPDPDAALDDELTVELELGGGIVDTATLGVSALPPSEVLTVELRPGEDPCTDPWSVCWNGAPTLRGDWETTLLLGGEPVQHLQWGEAARTRADDAVAAGVWPLARCGLPALPEDGAIELLSLETGHSPADYQ